AGSIEIQDGARHLRMKFGRPASPSWIDENAATPDSSRFLSERGLTQTLRALSCILNRHTDESMRCGADSIRSDDHAAGIDPHDDRVRLPGHVDLDRRVAVWILQESV